MVAVAVDEHKQVEVDVLGRCLISGVQTCRDSGRRKGRGICRGSCILEVEVGLHIDGNIRICTCRSACIRNSTS